MARRRRRGYGGTTEQHREHAKSTVREIKRLSRVIRTKFKAPPDCVHLAHLIAQLMEVEGVYFVDRHEGYPTRKGVVVGSARRILDRFVKACVVHPRSQAAARKMRAVWR